MRLQADSEDSDQTGRIPRLICFAGRAGHFVGFVVRRLKYLFDFHYEAITSINDRYMSK